MDELCARGYRALPASTCSDRRRVFGGIEPVYRFYKAFEGPVDAAHAAAAVGLETEAFLTTDS